MDESDPRHPRNMPIMASLTVGELGDLMAHVLSEILYDDGLDQLPKITLALESIAESLKALVQAGRPVHVISGLPRGARVEVEDPDNPGQYKTVELKGSR